MRQRGASSIEYGLIAASISIGIIASVSSIGIGMKASLLTLQWAVLAERPSYNDLMTAFEDFNGPGNNLSTSEMMDLLNADCSEPTCLNTAKRDAVFEDYDDNDNGQLTQVEYGVFATDLSNPGGGGWSAIVDL
jgi:Flp pilus assembly pilin Flp